MGARDRSKGFTLIELLVVIAIIAILAAILFPVFISAKKRAKLAVCVSNHKQLGAAFLAYTEDWDGMSVMGHTWPPGTTPLLSPPSGEIARLTGNR